VKKFKVKGPSCELVQLPRVTLSKQDSMDDMRESEVSLQREAEALKKKLLEAEARSKPC
jgi:hypothetical protein